MTVDGDGATLDLLLVLPAGATPVVVSWPDEDPDYLAGHRVEIADASAGSSLLLTVLSLDGAVTTFDLVDQAGLIGVALHLADDRTATMSFSQASAGGAVAIRGDGVPDYTATLAPGVATLPLTR